MIELRQVCLVAPRLGPAVALIESLLGLSVAFRDPHVAPYGLENAVFPIGADRFLEVVAPLTEGTAAGRFLAASGGRGGYMLIFDADDPDGRAARAEARGVRTAHRIAHLGYRACQLHPRDCRGAMLSLDRTETPGDWAPAGPDWRAHVRTGTVAALTGAEAVSPEPDSLAAHWAAILETPRGADGAIPLGDARLTVSAGEGRERLDALHLAVRDPERMLAEARAYGLETGEGWVRLCGVRLRLSPA